MNAAALLEWHNLLFVISILTSFVILLLSALTGLGHEIGGDVDADADADAGVDANADLGGAEAEHMIPGDAGHGLHGGGGALRALALLGIGRVPISVLLCSFLALFGAIGLIANQAFASIRLPPVAYFWPSLAIAGVLGLIVTGRLAALVARYMPSIETVRVTRSDLAGRIGTSVYGVDERSGQVQVRDIYGNLHRVAARTAGGRVDSGKEVLLEEYIPTGDYFIVSESRL
jgi:membrane protein implicated in regulation of membrane protease activity